MSDGSWSIGSTGVAQHNEHQIQINAIRIHVCWASSSDSASQWINISLWSSPQPSCGSGNCAPGIRSLAQVRGRGKITGWRRLREPQEDHQCLALSKPAQAMSTPSERHLRQPASNSALQPEKQHHHHNLLPEAQRDYARSSNKHFLGLLQTAGHKSLVLADRERGEREEHDVTWVQSEVAVHQWVMKQSRTQTTTTGASLALAIKVPAMSGARSGQGLQR